MKRERTAESKEQKAEEAQGREQAVDREDQSVGSREQKAKSRGEKGKKGKRRKRVEGKKRKKEKIEERRMNLPTLHIEVSLQHMNLRTSELQFSFFLVLPPLPRAAIKVLACLLACYAGWLSGASAVIY